MRIKSISIKDFKGVVGERFISFRGQNTIISGQNGSGKSTTADAHFWLWCDRDFKLRSNPNIRPSDNRECIPTVTEVLDINGTEITVSKSQKKKVSEPDKNGVQKVSLTNHYEINSVPKSERDFKKYFTELGVDFDTFLYLAHPESLLSDTKKLRPTIMGLGHSKTDSEVAQLTDGCGEVTELLKMYKTDEISAMQKATKKKAEAELLAIPERIIGLETAKVDIDVAELELQRNAIKESIAEIEAKIEGGGAERADEAKKLSDEIFRLKFEQSEAVRKANEGIVADINAANKTLAGLEADEQGAKNKLALAERNLEHANKGIDRANEDLNKAKANYSRYLLQAFDTSEMEKIQSEEITQESFICPTCGQMLTPEQQEAAKEKFRESKAKRLAEQEEKRIQFEKDKKRKLEDVTESGNDASERLKTAKAVEIEATAEIETAKSEIAGIAAKIAEQKKYMETLPTEADLSGNEDYHRITAEIAEKQAALSTMGKATDWQKEQKEILAKKRHELAAVQAEIAKGENNVRIDEKISALEADKRKNAQAKADAERILYQLDLVSRAKNEILAQEINSHFTGVRFKLFDFLKNGEYKEVCEPEALDGGEWKPFKDVANTSLVFRGKLAVLEGLQRAFNTEVPIFSDNAECNDTKSLAGIKCGRQLILMKVTDEPELTVKTME